MPRVARILQSPRDRGDGPHEGAPASRVVGVAMAVVAMFACAVMAWRGWGSGGLQPRLLGPALAALAGYGFLARCVCPWNRRAFVAGLGFLWLSAAETVIGLSVDPWAGSAALAVDRHVWLIAGRSAFAIFLWLALRSENDRPLTFAALSARLVTVVGMAVMLAVVDGESRFAPRADSRAGAFILPVSSLAAIALSAVVWTARRRRHTADPEHDMIGLVAALAALSHVALCVAPADSPLFTALAEFTWLAALAVPVVAHWLENVRRLRRSILARNRTLCESLALIGWLSFLALSDRLFAGHDIPRHAVAFGIPAMVIVLVLTVHAATILFFATLSKQVVDRFAALLSATRRFKNGDLEQRVDVGDHDELATMSLAFNSMAERIALQRRELDLLAGVVDGASEPLVVINPDRRIAFVNTAFSETTGISRHDAIGVFYADVLGASVSADLAGAIWLHLEERRAWSGNVMTRRASGEEVEAHVSIAAVEVAGQVTRFVAEHRDPRQLNELEQERSAFVASLVQLHQVTHSLIECRSLADVARRAAVGISRTIDGGCRVWLLEEPVDGEDKAPFLRLLSASGAVIDARDRLAVGEGCPGRAVAESRRIVCKLASPGGDAELSEADSGDEFGSHAAFPLRIADRVVGILEAASRGSKPNRLLETLQLYSEIVSAAASNALLHAKIGQQAYELGGLTNRLEHVLVNERAAAEALETVNAKLVAADRAKSQFLAATSHELRTPLSSIMGFLQLVLDDVARSPEEIREFVGEAHRCSRHLLGIINDVLDLAKIEAGRLRLTFGRVDALPLFRDVDSLTRTQAEAKGLTLTFSADDAATVHADYGRAKQMLLNLVGNAVKFTESGSITVSATARSERGLVEFSVRDTGIGIEREDQERLFEAFVQARGGLKREHGGSGLGLAITRRLVTMMGGVIKLSSAGAGHGTEVVFTLPIWRVAPFRPADDAAPPTPLAAPPGTTVVVAADHDTEFLRLVQATLEPQGVTVHVARTPGDAYRLALETRPHLLLSELVFPATQPDVLSTGLDLVQAVARNLPGAVDTIVVTGTDVRSTPFESALGEMADITLLEKPLDPRRLVELVQAARRRAGPQTAPGSD